MYTEIREPLLSPWASRTVTLVALAVGTLIIVLLDLVFAEDLMNLSIKVSISLQKVDLDVLSFILSYIVLGIGFVVFFFFVFVAPNKRRIFPMIFGFMVCLWLHGTAKLLYMDYRPSFLSEELRNTGSFCVAEFGKPSGHALFSFYVFLCLGKFLELRFFRGQSLKIALSFLANCVIAVLICVSRAYFGVHSINQVVLGSFFGWLIYFGVQVLQSPLKLYLYDPVFEKASPAQKRTSLCVLADVMGVLFLLLLLAFLRARYILSVDNTFVSRIKNCTQVLDNLFDQFTLGMELNGLHFILLNSWFVGLVFSQIDPALGLQFWFDRKVGWFLLRVAVYCAPVALVIPLRFLLSGHPAVVITIQTLVLAGLGLFIGVFGLNVLERLGIPLKKPEPVKPNNSLEVIEINDKGL